jgi:ribosome-associated protein
MRAQILANSISPWSDPLTSDPTASPGAQDSYSPSLDANDDELLTPAEVLEADGSSPGPQSADDFNHTPSFGGDPEGLLALIQEKLEDDQAQDIVVIDLKDKSPLADYIVVASGRSQRHVGAIADHLQRGLKDAGLGRPSVEGLPQADWVLIDAGDVIIHLFRPEVRAFYRIEQIWSLETPGAMARPPSSHMTDSTPQ